MLSDGTRFVFRSRASLETDFRVGEMPEQIGRFQILSDLSHSAEGCVYKASDPETSQTVALKTVALNKFGSQSAAWVQRLLEEAEATKVLNSHNIALLYGAGEIDGKFCAAMEYVQGNSIATMLARQESFSIWDLQDIARQLCQGLDHAHARKVFHYSLEPAKVMVSWDGTVKVLGFGISGIGATAAHAIGAPPEVLHYMSPEQVSGEPLDGRSNLFSLGAMLYEMVTDRKAFGGADAQQVREQILNSMPVPPVMILPKLPQALNDAIMRSMAKIPEQRYACGQELVADLEKCHETSAPGTPRKAPQPVPGINVPQKHDSRAQAEAAPEADSEAVSYSSSSSQNTGARDEVYQAAQSAAPEVAAQAKSGLAVKPRAAAAAAASAPGASSIPGAGAAKPANATMWAAWPTTAEPSATSLPMAPLLDDPADGAGRKARSFSDVSELPPLKEVYVAPPAPSPPAEPPVPKPKSAETIYQGEFAQRHTASKTKPVAADFARNAIETIKATPPKLFLYSVGAAVLIILLVVWGISSHIRSENSETEGKAPGSSAVSTSAETASSTPAPAESGASSTQPVPRLRMAPVEAETAQQPKREAISIVPRHVRKKPGKVLTALAPVEVVPGQLTVNSTPEGAQILVDGQNNPGWLTPFNVTGLAPGRHIVSVNKLGYGPETRTLDVASNSKSFLVVQLAPLGATVFLTSAPPGAAAFVDGKDLKRVTPLQVTVDKPGSHTITLRKQGFLDESTTANLQAGQTFSFSPVLRQLGETDDIRYKKFLGGKAAGMGVVNIRTQPKGAQVAINKHVLDRPSPLEFYLNPGVYVVDITLSGYKSLERVITIERNGKFAIDETLEHQ